ncbi:MAG: hypothetical protein JKX98_11105 [Alcanivoracaceae bacterium]|nr:hypothetical protein [Alcanivoracaceae bacterium]
MRITEFKDSIAIVVTTIVNSNIKYAFSEIHPTPFNANFLLLGADLPLTGRYSFDGGEYIIRKQTL